MDAVCRRQARALAAIRPISINRLLNRDLAKRWRCTAGACHMQGQIVCSTLNDLELCHMQVGIGAWMWLEHGK